MTKNKAITLIEFLIAAAVFSIISIALFLSLDYTRRSIEVAHVNTQLQEEMQNALGIMTLELRQTRGAKISAGPVTADDLWHSAIAFAVPFDIDSDGDILDATGSVEWSDENPINWSVRYDLSGNQITRTAGDGRNPILANNITALNFKRPILTPSIIEIYITARKLTFFNQAIEITLTNYVKMRN